MSALILAVISAIASAPFAYGAEKVSRPFEYSGYSYPEYEGFKKSSEFVIMSDGTRIAVDWFLPSDYTGAGTRTR
jgi:hypothetical protein